MGRSTQHNSRTLCTRTYSLDICYTYYTYSNCCCCVARLSTARLMSSPILLWHPHILQCWKDWRSNRIENKQSTTLLLRKPNPANNCPMQDSSHSRNVTSDCRIQTEFKSAFGLEQKAYCRKDNDNISPIFPGESITTRYALKGQKYSTSNTMTNVYGGKEDRTEYPSNTAS